MKGFAYRGTCPAPTGSTPATRTRTPPFYRINRRLRDADSGEVNDHSSRLGIPRLRDRYRALVVYELERDLGEAHRDSPGLGGVEHCVHGAGHEARHGLGDHYLVVF